MSWFKCFMLCIITLTPFVHVVGPVLYKKIAVFCYGPYDCVTTQIVKGKRGKGKGKVTKAPSPPMKPTPKNYICC